MLYSLFFIFYLIPLVLSLLGLLILFYKKVKVDHKRVRLKILLLHISMCVLPIVNILWLCMMFSEVYNCIENYLD